MGDPIPMAFVQTNICLALTPSEKLKCRYLAKRELGALEKLGTKAPTLMVGVHYQPPNLANTIHSLGSHRTNNALRSDSLEHD